MTVERDAQVPGQVPALVRAAQQHADARGFAASCEPPVGPLLAALAAAVPAGGRVLELGTGCGVGTAWLVTGLAGRTDVEVFTIERDPGLADIVRAADLPGQVRVLHADAEEVLPTLGTFDLVFADAEGGKWSGLHLTLDALAPSGVLLIDDMDTSRYQREDHRASVTQVRRALLEDGRLITAELHVGSGLLLATRRTT